jgi:hypothetical protein
MLRKENNLFIYLLMFSSCSHENKSNKYIEDNFGNYKNEFYLIKDSVKKYSESMLEDYTGEYMWHWIIDSLVCVNSSKDKLISISVISTGICKDCKSDEVIMMLGKKINKQWYFFQGGGTLIVPRDMYGKDEYHPLSFHELSQIARKEMFGENCLIKKDGEWIVNDEWVNSHFYNNGFYSFGKHREKGVVYPDEYFEMPRDKAKFDSVHWSLILDKWNHKIDTTEIKKQTDNYN